MPSTLQEFREGFFGTRPNRFLVEAAFPTFTNAIDDVMMYIKGADVPGSNIGIINVGWQGRVVKFSGERTYTDWVISIYDSSRTDLRNLFEIWINSMDERLEHQINYNVTTDWVVRYDDMQGTQSAVPTQGPGSYNKAIKLKNCFPVDISPITLSYDVSDSFAEFTVQIAYDYWEPTT